MTDLELCEQVRQKGGSSQSVLLLSRLIKKEGGFKVTGDSVYKAADSKWLIDNHFALVHDGHLILSPQHRELL